MRKKEVIAAVALLVAVAVAVLVATGVDAANQQRQAELKAASEASRQAQNDARTHGENETVRISSDDQASQAQAWLTGSMDAAIEGSKLYSSYEATGLPTGDGHFYGIERDSDYDGSCYLVFQMNVKNIDAVPTSDSKDGSTSFLCAEPKVGAPVLVYFDGSAENSAEYNVNRFMLAPGESKTLTACWQIPTDDGLDDLSQGVDLEFLGYIFRLQPEDCR